MHNAKICSAEPSSVKPDVPKLETGGSDISRGSSDLGETVGGRTYGLEDTPYTLFREP
jgi:hypothetical protein